MKGIHAAYLSKLLAVWWTGLRHSIPELSANSKHQINSTNTCNMFRCRYTIHYLSRLTILDVRKRWSFQSDSGAWTPALIGIFQEWKSGLFQREWAFQRGSFQTSFVVQLSRFNMNSRTSNSIISEYIPSIVLLYNCPDSIWIPEQSIELFLNIFHLYSCYQLAWSLIPVTSELWSLYQGTHLQHKTKRNRLTFSMLGWILLSTFIMWIHSDTTGIRLVMGHVFRKLKHGSNIIGCWNIYCNNCMAP